MNIGDTENAEAAAREQEVQVGTFGAMARRFDGQAGAFAYILFVLLYAPCVSATAAVYRETNAGWTTFLALWTTGLAYTMATIFYQAATFARHPSSSFALIVGMILVITGAIYGLKNARRPRNKNQPAL